MARDIFQKTILDSEVINGFNVPVLLEDIEVTVYEGGTYGVTNDIATIYKASTGSTQGPSVESEATGGPNPFFTGPSGLIEFWAETGFYDVVVSDTHVPNRIDDRVIQWNSISGAAEGIAGDFSIAPDTITTRELAGGSVLTSLGLNEPGVSRRGTSIIATEESRTNTSYGLLTTPDRVSSVVLPSPGLIVIGYQAQYKSSVAGAARAAIFIGSNQLKVQDVANRVPVTQATYNNSTFYNPLSTYSLGLVTGLTGTSDVSADVTTGQVIGTVASVSASQYGIEINGVNRSFAGELVGGGLCYIFATQGTYDISVQFKSSSGSVTVRNRKLWVWTVGWVDEPA